ncbi:hypothetical protein ERJ75_001282900 [Trypanosoma vivax]|nr:hypothetical protein ERJ75_001282900 [Trypanosoma vivax]
MGSCGGTKGATATETSARAVDTGQCCKAGRADTRRADPQVRVSEAMVRKRGGSRALGHRRRSKARDTEEPRQKGTKGHAATAASVAHAQKTPPPFAEDEVDLALSATSRSFSIKRNAKR